MFELLTNPQIKKNIYLRRLVWLTSTIYIGEWFININFFWIGPPFSFGCDELRQPEHGFVNCNYGLDGVPSYQDTCTYTCETGFEIIGNSTSTCQIDGTWSSINVTCIRGKISSLWALFISLVSHF